MTKVQWQHVEAMYRVMNYCAGTNKVGLQIKPNILHNNLHEITGYSDSDYAKDTETRKSVSGYSVFLNGSPVHWKSKMQECVTLSVTEAELVVATSCAQEMLYIKKVLDSIGIGINLPMILKVDNKGVKDLINNWSVGGRTRHISVKYFYLRELKEMNVIQIEWISSERNRSDLFTKNLPGYAFNKHARVFNGDG